MHTPESVRKLLIASVKQRGRRAQLARFCDVRADRVSEWLSGRAVPRGQHMLSVLEWLALRRAGRL